MYRYLLSLIVLLISISTLHAAPSIQTDTSSGVALNGQSFTVNGLAFGTKATAAPLKFDNMEGGTVGQVVANGWKTKSDGHAGMAPYHEPKYSSNAPRTGSTKHVLTEWPDAGTGTITDSHCPFWYEGKGEAIEYFYATFWIKVEYNGYYYNVNCSSEGGCGNVKWFNLAGYEVNAITGFYGTPSPPQPTIITSYGLATNQVFPTLNGVDNKSGLSMSAAAPTTTDWHSMPVQDGWDYKTLITEGVWVPVEVIAKESSAPGGTFDGTEDGIVIINYQFGGEGNVYTKVYDLADQATQVTNASGETRHWQGTSIFGLYNKDDIVNMTFEWDDIYIDDSWVRFVIGDDAVYANCLHREIQPLTAHSTTSATITVNQSSFADGGVYLFAIDDQNVASAGYAITIGAAPTGGSPAALGTGSLMNLGSGSVMNILE